MYRLGTYLSLLAVITNCDATTLWTPLALVSRSTNSSGDSTYPQIYEALDNHPNATGSFETIGFDLTKPYSPDDSNQTGWSIDIRVASNVSYRSLIYDNPEDNKVVRLNPTQILLKAPEDAFPGDELDPGWTTCLYTWQADMKDLNTTNAEQNDDDGTCTNVLSEQCLSDLRASSVSRGRCMSAIGASESCKEDLGKGNGVFSVVDLGDPNPNLVNDTRGLYEAMVALNPYSFANDTENTTSVYDYVVTSVWPVLLNIYYRDDAANATHSFSDFRCVRARNISDGGRQPETLGVRRDDSTNFGGKIALPALRYCFPVAFVIAVALAI